MTGTTTHATATEARPNAPHIAIRTAWLAQHDEDALEPALPIIDAHHHLWELPGKIYRAEDFVGDLDSGHNVRATVFVECHTHYRSDGPPEYASLGETEFALGEARRAQTETQTQTRVAAAQVGNADLALGAAVGPVLDRMLEVSEGRLRSIRNIAVWHADPNVRASAATPPPRLLLQSAFNQGMRELAARSLAFDAWLVHTQLAELRALAQAHPATTIVLNHVGGPLALGPYRGHRAEVFDAWHKEMAALAACPQVHVKLGGFGMALFGFDFHTTAAPPDSARVAEAIRPYVETCIELFGPARCMFESNFPVDKGCFSYGVIWNAYKRIAAGLDARDKAALFHDNAARVYGIE
ncbi:amidohydrolase family protein [Caballeronia sp. LZ065]|uniref:amidohydrolase family protein n=1 Tax=Caballeronia sp. LZ065 TaxID=3038571 RepID=UPI002865D31A|nr:amidohydrolase family protein [Caballeronia sp. LZ065]MDR5781475.1 amidohydrolase family protein [Caballeronia sp. LZ065]